MESDLSPLNNSKKKQSPPQWPNGELQRERSLQAELQMRNDGVGSEQ